MTQDFALRLQLHNERRKTPGGVPVPTEPVQGPVRKRSVVATQAEAGLSSDASESEKQARHVEPLTEAE